MFMNLYKMDLNYKLLFIIYFLFNIYNMVKSKRRYTKAKRGKRKTLRKTNKNTRRKKQRNVSRNKKGGWFFSGTRKKRRTWQNKVKQLTDAYPTICDKGEAAERIDGCKEGSPIKQKMTTDFGSFYETMKAIRPGRQEEIYNNRLANYRTLLEQVNLSLEDPTISDDIRSSLLTKKGIIEDLIKGNGEEDTNSQEEYKVQLSTLNNNLTSIHENKLKEIENVISNGISLQGLEGCNIPKAIDDATEGLIVRFNFETNQGGCTGECKNYVDDQLPRIYTKLCDLLKNYIILIKKLKNSAAKTTDLENLLAFKKKQMELLVHIKGKLRFVIPKVSSLARERHLNEKILESFINLNKILDDALVEDSSDLAMNIQATKLLEVCEDSGNRLFRDLKDKGVDLEEYFVLLRNLVPTENCTVDVLDIYKTSAEEKSSNEIARALKYAAGGVFNGLIYAHSAATQVGDNFLSVLPVFNAAHGGFTWHNPSEDVNATRGFIKDTSQKVDCGKLSSFKSDYRLPEKHCMSRDGVRQYCLMPGTLIIPISFRFDDEDAKNKYIDQESNHYNKFYGGDKSKNLNTLIQANTNKINDPYEYIKSTKKSRESEQVREDLRTAHDDEIYIKGYKYFIGINNRYKEDHLGGNFISVMNMVANVLAKSLDPETNFIVPGLCKGGGTHCHKEQGPWYERKISTLGNWDEIAKIDNPPELEKTYESILDKIFTYPVKRNETHLPGEKITLSSPLGSPFVFTLPEDLEEGAEEFMVSAPHDGIKASDEIIVLDGPQYLLQHVTIKNRLHPSKQKIVKENPLKRDDRGGTPHSENSMTPLISGILESEEQTKSKFEQERKDFEVKHDSLTTETQRKERDELFEFEKDPVKFLKNRYLIGYDMHNKQTSIYGNMEVSELVNDPKYKVFKDYVDQLQNYMLRTINIHVNYFTDRDTSRRKPRSNKEQLAKLKTFQKDLRVLYKKSFNYELKEKWRLFGLPDGAIKFVEEMSSKLDQFIYKKIEEIEKTIRFNKGLQWAGVGGGEDKYIDPYEAYIKPGDEERAKDEYRLLKNSRTMKDEYGNLIISGPLILISLGPDNDKMDIRRVDCSVNLGKEISTGVTDRARKLSIEECEELFPANNYHDVKGQARANPVMRALKEREEFGSAKFLLSVMKYMFNEMMLEPEPEPEQRKERAEKLELRKNNIKEFQETEKTIQEEKKFVKVLEEFKDLTEASGSTYDITLSDFCKESVNGNPRLDIDNTELDKKYEEMKTKLTEKHDKIHDMMKDLKKNTVCAYITAKDGLRFHQVSDGCLSGYPHWISQHDRRSVSCKPAEICSFHKIGTLRKIGAFSYNSLSYNAIEGANLENENFNDVDRCKGISQKFINKLIEDKNKKIEEITAAYQNPNIKISSDTFKQKCSELEEIYKILASVGISGDTETDVSESMEQMTCKIKSMTMGKDKLKDKLNGEELKKCTTEDHDYDYHVPYIKVNNKNNLTDYVPEGSIVIGVPLDIMSNKIREIQNTETQIPDLTREPVTFDDKDKRGSGQTWLCNLAVIPYYSELGDYIKPGNEALNLDEIEFDKTTKITLLPPDIVVHLGGDDGIATQKRWRNIKAGFLEKIKSYINYLTNNIFVRYIKNYLIGKIGQVIGSLIVVTAVAFICPPLLPVILPLFKLVPGFRSIGSLFGLFNISQGGGSYNNIKINYLSNRNIIKDKKLIKDKNKITKKRKGKSRNRKKITTKNKKSKRYYK